MSVVRKVQPIVVGGATANAPSHAHPPAASVCFSAITHREADRAVVVLGGELDLASVTLLADCLTALGPEVKQVVLDFGELDFIGCCGLHVIADIAESLTASGGSLGIRSVAPQARRVLDLVNAIVEAGLPPAAYGGASATGIIGPRGGRVPGPLSLPLGEL
jgi:anti-anti-sigma factor